MATHITIACGFWLRPMLPLKCTTTALVSWTSIPSQSHLSSLEYKMPAEASWSTAMKLSHLSPCSIWLTPCRLVSTLPLSKTPFGFNASCLLPIWFPSLLFSISFNSIHHLLKMKMQIPMQIINMSISRPLLKFILRLDPEGKKLAWIEWSYPNMPWDRSQLWVGYISDNGDIYKRVCVGGDDPSIVESPTEPKWSSEGELFFVTDRNLGFWNLHRWVESDNKVLPVYSLEAEFTRPSWVFGINSYELLEEKKNLIACSYRQKGRSYLAVVDKDKHTLTVLQTPFTDLRNITSGIRCLYVEGASAIHPLSVAKVTLDDEASKVVDFKIVWSSSPTSSQYESYFSSPELLEFPTEVPGEKAYACYYPPTNPMYQASQDEKPPLLLESHGGPTDEARGILNLSIQFWTSRGWAFVDVNYGGSTGYGREFRERLLKHWGIVDVNDCCSCAQFLVESGKVDGERLCITGCSAGGFTTLSALAFKETFKAGASLFGVADAKLLKEQIPKFEAYYIDNLIGSEKGFIERNPINSVDRFSCPIILFQGLEDKVVNPEQAKTIYKALKSKGLPVALVEYEGEQHGFRKAENIKYTLEQQMVFFARVVGHFKVADEFTPIKIDNFD